MLPHSPDRKTPPKRSLNGAPWKRLELRLGHHRHYTDPSTWGAWACPPILFTIIPFSAQNAETTGYHCWSTASRSSNFVAGERTWPIRVISSASTIGDTRAFEAAS